jgi:hypothetical protein
MTSDFFDFDQKDDKRLRQIADSCKRDIEAEYESLKARLIFIFVGMGIVGAVAAVIDWFFWPPVRMREAIEWLGWTVVIFGIPAYCSTLLRVGELRVRAQLRGQLAWYTGHLREELEELKNDLLSEIQSRAKER